MQKLLNLGPKLGRGGKGLVFQKVNCGNLCLSFCLFLAADELSFPEKKRDTVQPWLYKFQNSLLAFVCHPGRKNKYFARAAKLLQRMQRSRKKIFIHDQDILRKKNCCHPRRSNEEKLGRKKVTIKLSRDTWGKSSVSNCSKFACYAKEEK